MPFSKIRNDFLNYFQVYNALYTSNIAYHRAMRTLYRIIILLFVYTHTNV